MLAFFRLALAVLRLCWLHWYMIFVFVNVGRENLKLRPRIPFVDCLLQ